MAEEAIESITKKSSTQRQKMWDHWQKVYDEFHAELKDLTKDPFETKAGRALAKLGSFLINQMEREYARDHAIHMHDHQLKELKAATQPDLVAIGLCFLQIVGGGIVSAGIGCAPSVLGVTGSAAKSYQAISGGFQAVFGQGGGTVLQFYQSGKEAQKAEINAKMELTRQIAGDHTNHQQHMQRLQQASADEEKNLENKEFETKRMLNNG